MAKRDVIVVGASAGGVEALKTFVATLPKDLAASIVVVVHVSAHAESVLPAILTRSGPLPAKKATDGDRLEHGHIYVAPPDHHVLVADDHLRVTRGPRVNNHRPAIDPLFRSAARRVGPRAIGIVMSGVLDDGTAGASAIKARGGAVIVQAPSDALYPAMPQSVLDRVSVDACVPVAEMVNVIVPLTALTVPEVEKKPMPDNDMELEEPNEEHTHGPPTMFTCPDCHGTLWERDHAGVLEYRCHVGHAFSPDNWIAAQSEELEDALWAAYRTLRESAVFCKRLADRSRKQGLLRVAKQYETRSAEAADRAALIRRTLELGHAAPKDESGEA